MNPDEERIVRESSSVKDKGRRFLLKIIGGVFLICLIAGVVGGLSSWLTLRQAAEDGTDLARQLQVECDKPRIVSPQLAQFCPEADEVVDKAPEVVKDGPIEVLTGPPGAMGPTGPTGASAPALTRTQIQGALRLFCENTGSCRGQDGADATATQVAIAVSSYCNSRGECRGPAGINGTDGADGEDADPVTQGQIIAAVEDYCNSNNGCRGPEGEAGANGQNGSDGPRGEQGPPGVVNVVDDCAPAPDGQTIANVDPVYNADTQTVTISCTYKDDQTAPVPEEG